MLQRTVNRIENGVAVPYTFTSAMEDGSQTAEIRAVQASIYMQREFVHGLPLAVAKEIYAKMVEILHAEGKRNEIKQQELAVLIHNLQLRAANAVNHDNLLGLACIYFYIDGEDPAMYDGAKDAEKIKLMKSGTADDWLFFCQKVCEYTPQLSSQLDKDLPDYLQRTKELIESQMPMNIP